MAELVDEDQRADDEQEAQYRPEDAGTVGQRITLFTIASAEMRASRSISRTSPMEAGAAGA